MTSVNIYMYLFVDIFYFRAGVKAQSKQRTRCGFSLVAHRRDKVRWEILQNNEDVQPDLRT